MSYNYHIQNNLTISGERLVALGQRYGYSDVNYNNLNMILKNFNDEFGTFSDIQWGANIESTRISVYHIGRVSEHESIDGIVNKVNTLNGIIDPTTITVEDDNRNTATITLN